MNDPPTLWEEEAPLQGPCSPAAHCCKAGMERGLGEQQEVREPILPPEAPGKVRNITAQSRLWKRRCRELLWRAQPWLCSEKEESFPFPVDSRAAGADFCLILEGEQRDAIPYRAFKEYPSKCSPCFSNPGTSSCSAPLQPGQAPRAGLGTGQSHPPGSVLEITIKRTERPS